MRRKGKVIACLLLSVALLGGCSSNNSNAVSDTSTSAKVQSTMEADESVGENVTEQTSLFGKVTENTGETLTIALAEQPEAPAGMQGGMMPSDMPAGGEGAMPSDMPAGEEGEMPPDMPAGGEGAMPSDMPAGGEGEMPSDMPAGGNAPQQELTLTGNSQTVTVTENTTITVNGQEATIDDINTDDVVTVQMSGEEAVSINVGFGGGQAPGKVVPDTNQQS